MTMSSKFISFLILITLLCQPVWPIQQSRQNPKRRPTPTEQDDQRVTKPVTVMSSPPDYLSGEVTVSVTGNQNPIIKIGLAHDGVSIIEFPANDLFFAIHPGNSELVTVEDSPSKATDHFIVLRPGTGFIPPSGNGQPGPATSILVQMTSGMVITILVYPVRFLAEEAHHCFVNYRRSEIVAARRAAGLAVNLDGSDQPAQPPTPQILSGAKPTDGQQRTTVTSAKESTSQLRTVADIELGKPKHRGKPTAPVTAVRNALEDAAKHSKNFKNWNQPVHGLSISSLAPIDISDQDTVIVFAVKNTSNQALHLIPGQPELSVTTLDDKGKPIQIQPISPLFSEASVQGSTIGAGATIYYAVAFSRPVLGANQRFTLSVAQSNAADQPNSTQIK